MPMEDDISRALAAAIDCQHLQVGGDGRHFQALVVSGAFSGLSKVRRHQLVYRALGGRMESDIHALSIRALAPEEWDG